MHSIKFIPVVGTIVSSCANEEGIVSAYLCEITPDNGNLERFDGYFKEAEVLTSTYYYCDRRKATHLEILNECGLFVSQLDTLKIHGPSEEARIHASNYEPSGLIATYPSPNMY